MRRRWAIFAMALAFAVVPQSALACSCAQSTKTQHAERALLVFTGTVSGVAGPLFGIRCSTADPVAVSFAVETVYKGDVPKEFSLKTASEGASCGYSFIQAKRYTVFVIRLSGDYETNLCVGNVEGAISPAEYGLPEGRPPRS